MEQMHFSFQSQCWSRYLPFLFHDVLEHFKKSAVARMGQPYELWFDYNHIAPWLIRATACREHVAQWFWTLAFVEALKWHFPLGVLCDALVGKEAMGRLVQTHTAWRLCFMKVYSRFFHSCSGLFELMKATIMGCICRGYIRIMETNMETTIIGCIYIYICIYRLCDAAAKPCLEGPCSFGSHSPLPWKFPDERAAAFQLLGRVKGFRV